MSGHGVWPLLEGIQDPQLKRLAQNLPDTVLRSRANSTTKKYLGAFRRRKDCASKHNLDVFPIQGTQLSLYLQHVAESTGLKSAAEEIVNAVTWLHSLAGLSSPAECPFVTSVLDGLRRMLAKPTIKKDPINIEILTAMVEDTRKSESLSNVRLTAACLLAFAGFLRFDELSKLRPVDLKIDDQKMTVVIRSSKTDQLWKGSELVIARTGTTTCPVQMLERYISMGQISKEDTRPLFRPITKSKKGRASGNLTYSRMRELLRDKLRQLGYPPDRFSVHSLRAGGATAAANAGVSDCLFKRHGRWRSEGAKDGYVEDSLLKRLEVTQHLGL